jgi:hypothetical protein
MNMTPPEAQQMVADLIKDAELAIKAARETAANYGIDFVWNIALPSQVEVEDEWKESTPKEEESWEESWEDSWEASNEEDEEDY